MEKVVGKALDFVLAKGQLRHAIPERGGQGGGHGVAKPEGVCIVLYNTYTLVSQVLGQPYAISGKIHTTFGPSPPPPTQAYQAGLSESPSPKTKDLEDADLMIGPGAQGHLVRVAVEVNISATLTAVLAFSKKNMFLQ